MSISSISHLAAGNPYSQLTKLKLPGNDVADKNIAAAAGAAPRSADNTSAANTQAGREAAQHLQELQHILGQSRSLQGDSLRDAFNDFKAAFKEFVKSLQGISDPEKYQQFKARAEHAARDIIQNFKDKTAGTEETPTSTVSAVNPAKADVSGQADDASGKAIVLVNDPQVAEKQIDSAAGNVGTKVVDLTV